MFLGLLGGCPGHLLGPGGPKVSAGTEKERQSEFFPPRPGTLKETKIITKTQNYVFLLGGAKQNEKKEVPGAGRGHEKAEN